MIEMEMSTKATHCFSICTHPYLTYMCSALTCVSTHFLPCGVSSTRP